MNGPTPDRHGRPTPGSVRSELDVRLVVPGDVGVSLTVELCYDPADPFAVHATFRAPDGSVEWVFARDLLADGLERPVGVGDVRVWPAWRDPNGSGMPTAAGEGGCDVVCLALVSPDGQALLEIDAWALEGFVRRMHAAVRPGEEAQLLDLDRTLESLLG